MRKHPGSEAPAGMKGESIEILRTLDWPCAMPKSSQALPALDRTGTLEEISLAIGEAVGSFQLGGRERLKGRYGPQLLI
ncbi:hypothetical protein [Pelagicoccus sp. SDUM812002]|uniref:hypothetical protein n=1 Tax=Pelagicoccus sp. SDUM812002 TaxID=3041266 RepID=UPI0028100ACF|nr:hypothetical protein [Pelagicoccus sp. SDUM812002]MDQ8188353.1 hypothetical protein [Pelagicoccus sp. SDUM812002]